MLVCWFGLVGGVGVLFILKKINGNLQFLQQQTEKDVSEKAVVLNGLYSVFYSQCVISLNNMLLPSYQYLYVFSPFIYNRTHVYFSRPIGNLAEPQRAGKRGCPTSSRTPLPRSHSAVAVSLHVYTSRLFPHSST